MSYPIRFTEEAEKDLADGPRCGLQTAAIGALTQFGCPTNGGYLLATENAWLSRNLAARVDAKIAQGKAPAIAGHSHR